MTGRLINCRYLLCVKKKNRDAKYVHTYTYHYLGSWKKKKQIYVSIDNGIPIR